MRLQERIIRNPSSLLAWDEFPETPELRAEVDRLAIQVGVATGLVLDDVAELALRDDDPLIDLDNFAMFEDAIFMEWFLHGDDSTPDDFHSQGVLVELIAANDSLSAIASRAFQTRAMPAVRATRFWASSRATVFHKSRPLLTWDYATWLLWIDNDFRLECFSNHGFCNNGLPFILQRADADPRMAPENRLLTYDVAIIGTALSLMSCKNVVRRERAAEFTRETKASSAVTGTASPRVRQYELLVHPLRKRSSPTGGNHSDGISDRPVHICRGHFATYGDDGPLFGKHVGRYWVPSHVKGNPANGEIHKTYRLKSPEPAK